MALGTAPASTPQMGLVPSGPQTPNRNACGVAANPRAWSGLKPSWPVSTTANDHPEPGVPKADAGSAIVIVLAASEESTAAVPTEFPFASTHTGAANPCTSIRWVQASAGAIVVLRWVEADAGGAGQLAV